MKSPSTGSSAKAVLDRNTTPPEIDAQVLAEVPHISREDLDEAWKRVGESFQADADAFRRLAEHKRSLE